MNMANILRKIGYMTKDDALSEGFTHHGSYYGIPIWIGDPEGVFMVATKWATMEFMMSIFHVFEGLIRPIMFPNEPNCFQFQLGKEIR